MAPMSQGCLAKTRDPPPHRCHRTCAWLPGGCWTLGPSGHSPGSTFHQGSSCLIKVQASKRPKGTNMCTRALEAQCIHSRAFSPPRELQAGHGIRPGAPETAPTMTRSAARCSQTLEGPTVATGSHPAPAGRAEATIQASHRWTVVTQTFTQQKQAPCPSLVTGDGSRQPCPQQPRSRGAALPGSPATWTDGSSALAPGFASQWLV